jgi:hypothetical protein
VESKAAGFVYTLGPMFQAASPTIGPRGCGDGLRIFVSIAKSRFHLDFHQLHHENLKTLHIKFTIKPTRLNALSYLSKTKSSLLVDDCQPGRVHRLGL